jgi:hypothetical protein
VAEEIHTGSSKSVQTVNDPSGRRTDETHPISPFLTTHPEPDETGTIRYGIETRNMESSPVLYIFNQSRWRRLLFKWGLGGASTRPASIAME